MSKEELLYHTQISSPLGILIAAASAQGIVLLDFAEKSSALLRIEQLATLLKLRLQEGENEHLHKLREELTAYFSGQLKVFSLPLQLVGSEFQKSVWLSLATIPFGETLSYGKQAERLGAPKSVRAVASANARNPISILLPCHRVIGSDGKLKGYAGGIERKKFLLDFEKKA